MQEIEFILYVANQEKSKLFYQQLLQIKPCLDVPGMTEFKLSNFVKLGLMPENSISRIIQDKMPHPSRGTGIPRCELYLKVRGADDFIARGIELGGIHVDELRHRDWGDQVGYISDPDGHIIAFAEKKKLRNKK